MNSSVKIDVPFTFSSKKTYFVFIKSRSGTVEIEGNNVSVNAINIITNDPENFALSGGCVFSPLTGFDMSFGVTFPYSRDGINGIYIIRPKSTSVASIFDIGIFEL